MTNCDIAAGLPAVNYLLHPSCLRVDPLLAPFQDEVDGVIVPLQVSLICKETRKQNRASWLVGRKGVMVTAITGLCRKKEGKRLSVSFSLQNTAAAVIPAV